MKTRKITLICCGIALLLAACGKSDKFTGTYVGQANLKISKYDNDARYHKPESTKTFDDVSMVLEGDSQRDFVLTLIFGENSPVKNCTMRVSNNFLSAFTEGRKDKDDENAVLWTGLDEDFQANKRHHTCAIENDGVTHPFTFRTGTVTVEQGYMGGMNVKFDTVIPKTDYMFDFEFVGATSKEALAKYKELREWREKK